MILSCCHGFEANSIVSVATVPIVANVSVRDCYHVTLKQFVHDWSTTPDSINEACWHMLLSSIEDLVAYHNF
jgi:hypothetical protein